MDHKLLLVKGITLLYRESQIPDSSENSADLVRTALESVVLPESAIGMSQDVDILRALKDAAMEMCCNPVNHEYDVVSLLQRLKLACGYDDNLYDTIEQGIVSVLEPAVIKRTVINLRKSINNYFKSKQIEEVLSKAAYKFKYGRQDIQDVNQFVAGVIDQLEPLQVTTAHKDPAVVTDIDLGDDKALTAIFNEVRDMNNNDGVMRLGWGRANRMLQGGIRRGETIIIPALQHKYKTGLTLSMFTQIPLFNKPYMLDQNKKPLLLRISFEDDLNLNMQFIYQYLMYNETLQPVDMRMVGNDQMSMAIRSRLQEHGYHIKMLRVDPSQWTYRNICNKIIELEAQGYEIHLMMLDYLMMVPTTGCVMGPAGTDMRDMIRRIRNFCAPKKIAMATPHQLSTEAKQLIRNGVPEDRFVKDINEKGYYSGSKQLDQEVDLEIYLHIFKHKRETYMTLQRGKHRIPTILPDEHKYGIWKFPKNGMPIPHDRDGVESGWGSLREALEAEGSEGGGGGETFSF